MASYSGEKAQTRTLSTTVADDVTITNPFPAVEVTNFDASNTLYVRMDGTVPVADAVGCTPIRPSSSKILKSQLTYPGPKIVVGVVGSGGKYTVEGVN